EREPRIAVRELVVDDARRDRVEPGAAVGLGHGDADQAERAELPQQRHVERAGLVVLHRLRLDAALPELAHRLPQQLVLVSPPRVINRTLEYSEARWLVRVSNVGCKAPLRCWSRIRPRPQAKLPIGFATRERCSMRRRSRIGLSRPSPKARPSIACARRSTT